MDCENLILEMFFYIEHFNTENFFGKKIIDNYDFIKIIYLFTFYCQPCKRQNMKLNV